LPARDYDWIARSPDKSAVDALPRSATGKINKPTLRQQLGSPEATGTTQAAAW
jgi:hypothetical protein